MNRAVIIPTGKEIKEGIVQDTDSPMICRILGKMYEGIQIQVASAVLDEEEEICRRIRSAAGDGADLVVLIGGSGGGHRFSRTLADDYTHSGMEKILEDKTVSSLYGKNGHLWSRLVCGVIGKTIVFNVPGPYREASAAMEAVYQIGAVSRANLTDINHSMAEAVRSCYETGAYC